MEKILSFFKMEVGIDIEEIERFNLDKNSSFLKKVFNSYEIDYSFSKSNPSQTLCGIFCAKEALIKTLKKFELPNFESDIKVIHDSLGKPIFDFSNFKISNEFNFSLSISHCKTYATAVVIKTKNKS